MPVIDRIAPADAHAARRSLREQIARLEGELSRILASTYPPIAPERRRPETPRGGSPRLLDLEALERTRDDLAARLSHAHRAQRDQHRRQQEARALLAEMYADPARHKRAVVANRDLGLPGCTTYRVTRRLFSGWWRVKVSSGCPLPSAADREPPQPQAPPPA